MADSECVCHGNTVTEVPQCDTYCTSQGFGLDDSGNSTRYTCSDKSNYVSGTDSPNAQCASCTANATRGAFATRCKCKPGFGFNRDAYGENFVGLDAVM